jgi:hypothetical protein
MMAAGLGMGSVFIGSWIGSWIFWPIHSPFIANVFSGWVWNAWLWLVFAPISLVVARIFPVNTTLFVWVGGVSGFFFWLLLNTALFGFEKFEVFPLYALSCLLWFIAGLFWAWGFARRGEYLFRKAQERAKALSKSNERHYAQWAAVPENTTTVDSSTADTPSAEQTSSGETQTAEAKREPEL